MYMVFLLCYVSSELDNFRTNGGEPPRCSFTLCFGEELSNTEDPTKKLITAQVKETKQSLQPAEDSCGRQL